MGEGCGLFANIAFVFIKSAILFTTVSLECHYNFVS